MVKHLIGFAAFFLFLVPVRLDAQLQTIEIDDVQLARSLSGVVVDPSDALRSGVLVEEFSAGWKKPLRSTMTDEKGKFKFSSVKGRDTYYSQLSMEGFDFLRLRVKLDRKRGTQLRVKLIVAS